jgi:TPR repeat protein
VICYYLGAASGGNRIYKPHSSVYVPPRREQAFELLRNDRWDDGLEACWRLARTGDVDAKAVVGWMLFVSVDTERSVDVAEQLLHEASESGSDFATFGLAWLSHTKGLSGECFTLMSRAAQHGFLPAVLDLGRLYWNGIGTRVDAGKAEVQFCIAARRRHGMAATFLLQLWATGACGQLKARMGRILRPLATRICILISVVKRHGEGGLTYTPP